jgi:acyl-CoA synthetase (AMP-forming)/AMP-acid ligase II
MAHCPECETEIDVDEDEIKEGQTVFNIGKKKRERVNRLLRMHANHQQQIDHVDAGDIAVVIGLKDPEWSRRVHALIQLRPGVDADAALAALPGYCKQLLAPYKVPRSYEIVAALGRTEAGKINRQALVKAREESVV